MLQALVVVVHRNCKRALGDLLANDVLVKTTLDLTGNRKIRSPGLARGAISRGFVADDVVTQLNAFITDEYRGPRYQFLDLMLALTAEGAVKNLFARGTFLFGHVLLRAQRCSWREVDDSSSIILTRSQAGQDSEKTPENTPQPGRRSSTWSMSPYSLASVGDMKKSRSMSAVIFSKVCPVRSA